MSKRGSDLGRDMTTYRISELVDAAGVSRDMIKYYLRAGLLPPAQKPRPNLSHYTVEHLQLIGLIRRFQEQTRLSLADIAELFKTARYDPSTIEIELLSERHNASNDNNIIPLHNNPVDNSGLELPTEFLEQLQGSSLLSSDETGQEEQTAALMWAAHEAGVPLEFFESAKRKVAELADLEVKTLIAIKRPGMNFTETMDNVTDVDRIINRWMITEKKCQIRSQFQRVIENSERAISTLIDAIYQPSQLFCERYRVEELLSALREQVRENPDILARTFELCDSTLSLGAYEETIFIAQAAISHGVNKDIATAFIALAHGIQDDVDAAYDYACQLENCGENHPVILQARMLSLLLKAAKLGGVADTNELMKSAGELFLELPQEPDSDDLETTLLLARANVAFPDFANSCERAIRALDELCPRIMSAAILPDLPIAGLADAQQQVYRINVLYYLGVLQEMSGQQEIARNYFEQVIQIDPASNFGINAYRRLG